MRILLARLAVWYLLKFDGQPDTCCACKRVSVHLTGFKTCAYHADLLQANKISFALVNLENTCKPESLSQANG